MVEISLPQGGTSSDRFLRRMREGLLSSIRHQDRETAGDWLVTTTPIGGACLPLVATKIYPHFAGHNVRPASSDHELPHQFTQRRCAARIGIGLIHLTANVKIYRLFREHPQKSRLIYFSLSLKIILRNGNMNLQL